MSQISETLTIAPLIEKNEQNITGRLSSHLSRPKPKQSIDSRKLGVGALRVHARTHACEASGHLFYVDVQHGSPLYLMPTSLIYNKTY